MPCSGPPAIVVLNKKMNLCDRLWCFLFVRVSDVRTIDGAIRVHSQRPGPLQLFRALLRGSLWVGGLLWLAGAFVGNAATVNLLPQGNFRNPGANTRWAEGFNIPGNEEFRVVSDGKESWLRIENRESRRQLDYVHAYVRIPPRVVSLTVSARLKATNLKTGSEGWHNARVALKFEGSEASVYPPEVPELSTNSDWVLKSVCLTVPKGATRLNIQPAMFYCTGVFEVADLTVTPHLGSTSQLANAELPPGISLDWEKQSIVKV
ncbi:MAG: hypothetical protein N3G20_05540, partial [Verrucomicrobiae bacterium]|nr:hypothetical protein [Verrucomicrobiae bacterium]